MFLRNYDNLSVLQQLTEYLNTTNLSPSSIGGTSMFGEGYLNLRSTNGNCNAVTMCSSPYYFPIFSLGPKGICLGSGTAEVTYEDYKLSGEVIANKLVQVSINRTFNVNNHKWTSTLVATYNNSASTDVVISEWGLWRTQNSSYATDFNNAASYHFLMFREVLDEPIVIEAGTTATLTFSVDVPMPNHP